MASQVSTKSVSSSTRAQWTPDRTKTFVELCYEEVLKGNRPSGTFNKKGWKNIVQGFAERKGVRYDKQQMKNKLTTLKIIWINWCKLDSHAGLRKDPVTGAVTVDDQTWAIFVEAHPECADFRRAPPLHLKELSTIFGDTIATIATGSKSWAPSMGTHPAFEDVDPTTPELVPGTPLESQHVEEGGVGDDIDCEDDIQRGRRCKRRLSDTMSTSVSRSTRCESWESTESRLERLIIKLCDAIILSYMPRPPIPSHTPTYTVRDCMEELHKMEEDVPKCSILYNYAVTSFMDPLHREVWMAMQDNSARLSWLKYQLATRGNNFNNFTT